MKRRIFVIACTLLALSACGPGPQSAAVQEDPIAAMKARDALPRYDSMGVIAALEGQKITLDHDGASTAGLAPGRNDFIVYGDVLSDAPMAPGSRVKFRFLKTDQGLELETLEPR